MMSDGADRQIKALHDKIAARLAELGADPPYLADANEPDPRYLGYGVRAPEMKALLRWLKPDVADFSAAQKVDLARRLIASGYGEQKTVAIALLEQVAHCFTPERFDEMEGLVRGLHGWSKIDAVTKLFLPELLAAHEDQMLERVARWNADDDRWMRRASVVLFTRKVAKTGRYESVAMEHCDALIFDREHLIQTGVGWCLRDLMRWHKATVLPYVIDLRRKGVSSKITLYALRDIKGAERKAVLEH